jgi:glutaredoxin
MIKIFLFTMEGCPYCVEMKDLLSKDGIEYLEKDIVQHESEFDDFSTLVGGNEFVPAILCITIMPRKRF